jgi:hypothetical protein
MTALPTLMCPAGCTSSWRRRVRRSRRQTRSGSLHRSDAPPRLLPAQTVAIKDASNALPSAEAAGSIVLATPQAAFPATAQTVALAAAQAATLADSSA